MPTKTEEFDMTSLTLTPTESVKVRTSTPEVLEVEVTYGPGSGRPPAHLHPHQDESFEVLSGTIGVRIEGEERVHGPGDAFEVPRGAVHQMWNPGDEPARAIWQTRPAKRTREWFGELDAAQRAGATDRNGMPGPLLMGVLLTRYSDVFRLAARPRSLVRAALAVLSVAGRLRGYGRAG
jgi:mannose-6-phosphate isomerase-like protein (cupin superfamily)